MAVHPAWLHPCRSMQRQAWRVLLVVLALALWCAGSGTARAAATINSMTVNGQSSTTVVSGSTVTVQLIVTFTNGTRWRMTQVDTSPASSLSMCIDNSDSTTNGTYSFTFDVTAPATTGVYDLLFAIHPNANCSSPATTGSFPGAIKVDNTFPSVLSIVRDLPNPTNASPVTWTVTFDRPVSGVSLGDFALAASGVGGTSLSGTITSSSVYTLQTPNTGSGTLGLNVVDNDSIVGDNGLPLGGAGTGNGNFTGEVYTIDRAGPTFPVVSISSNNAVSPLFARVGDQISVAFTTADASAVQTPTATINGVAATVTGSGSNWVASRLVVAGDVQGLVAFKLDVKDVLGNVATSRTTVTDGTSVTIDTVAPVASISCANPTPCGAANPVPAGQVSWNVTFSEAVTGVGAANFSFSGSGAAGASIASVTGGPNAWTVVANVSTAGVVGLNLSQNLASVRDRAGNNPAANNAVAGNSYTVGGCSVAAGGGCTFDAVEAGAGAATPIFTRRVGAPVTLDILALNGAVLNTGSADTVQATLVVATNNASCGTVAVSNTVAVVFAPANGGRRSATFTPSRAARDVRVRLDSSGVTACSSDNFALRPDALAVASGDATADAGGASASATPVFKAGSTPFGMQASSAVGYDGTPLVNQNRLLVPAGAKGAIAGTFGAANAATGVASGVAFTYGEAGYVALNSWGVYDNGGFAGVDSSKGECFTDASLGTAAAPADPNTANGAGKLGCYFGSAASPYFGRFIPDHFALSAGAIVNRSATPACAASTFTYMGEALTPGFVLTAQNAANATTLNYTGTLARLDVPTQLGLGAIDDAPVRRPLATCAATPVAPCLSPGVASGSFSNGVSGTIAAPLTVLRAAAAVAPYTVFKVGVAPVDPDGVRIAAYNLDTVNIVAGAAQHALVASTIVRYGRVQVDNAYGSELLNLGVRIAAQYWNGTGYATNTLDSCTPLGPAGFTLGLQKGGLTAANMDSTHVLAGSAMAGGAGRVLLAKPSPAPATKGSAVLQSGSSYLPGSGRVTFGVYKSGPVIYVRETY